MVVAKALCHECLLGLNGRRIRDFIKLRIETRMGTMSSENLVVRVRNSHIVDDFQEFLSKTLKFVFFSYLSLVLISGQILPDIFGNDFYQGATTLPEAWPKCPYRPAAAPGSRFGRTI